MGDSSCVCPSSSYLVETSERDVRAALGPAYEDYKSGKIDIKTTWEQDKLLEPFYLPECCAKLSFDFTRDDLWEGHTIFMAVFLATSITLLGVFIALRDQQPFKFRDVKAVTILVTIVMILFVIVTLTGNSSGTSHVVPTVIAGFVGGPTVAYYYTVKALQLRFLISWGEAKLKKNNYATIQQFYRFRFLLDFRFYVAGLCAVLIITVIPAIYTLTQRDVFEYAMTRNNFSTLRCSWYNIPAEYQQPKSDSQLCECVKSGLDIEGESNLVLCYQAYTKKCVTPVADDDDELNEGFCEACSNAFSTGDMQDKQCVSYLAEFAAEGNCGFPAMTPAASTCVSSIYSDRTMGYVCASIALAFTLINVLALIPVIRKRDDYGMIFENVLTAVLCNIVTLLSTTSYFEDNLGLMDWYYDGLGIRYRAQFVFTFLSSWIVVLCSLGIPLGMWAYRTKWWNPLASDHVKSSRANERSAGPHITSGADVVETVDLGSIFHVKRPRTDFEAAVEQYVTNSALLAIYSQYAVEAFHIENVRFLEETYQFFQMVESHSDIADLRDKATQISVQFVGSSAAFQVNLSAKLRESIEANLDAMVKLLTSLPSDAQGEDFAKVEQPRERPVSAVEQYDALDALVESLAQAYLEVRRLLGRDAWPRFRMSRFYPLYQLTSDNLRAKEERLTAAIDMMGAAPSMRISVRRGSEGRSSGLAKPSSNLFQSVRKAASNLASAAAMSIKTSDVRTGTDSELHGFSESQAESQML